MNFSKISYIVAMILIVSTQSKAQDPKLPATNLGLSNLQDGNPPKAGWYFLQYIQNYQAITNHGPFGLDPGGERVNSLLSMSQLIFISPSKLAGGNLGFTVLVPIVRLSATGAGGSPPSVNPNSLGDIVAGPFLQWFHKRLFGMPFSHRLEVDLVSPVGAYKSSYNINPGSHLLCIVLHYTFTVFPAERLSVSMRDHFNYYFNEIGTDIKPGISYNFNYSLEYRIISSFRAEIAGYCLKQLQQDSKNGDSNYFQNRFGISDTREQVFACGTGISYVTPSGLFIELKCMKETAARNRSDGFRTTLALSYKLDK